MLALRAAWCRQVRSPPDPQVAAQHTQFVDTHLLRKGSDKRYLSFLLRFRGVGEAKSWSRRSLEPKEFLLISLSKQLPRSAGDGSPHTLEVDIQYTDGTRIERRRLDNSSADNVFIPNYGALQLIRVYCRGVYIHHIRPTSGEIASKHVLKGGPADFDAVAFTVVPCLDGVTGAFEKLAHQPFQVRDQDCVVQKRWYTPPVPQPDAATKG